MNEYNIHGYTARQCEDWPNYAITSCGIMFRISTGKAMTHQLRGVPPTLCVRVCHNGVAKHAAIHRAVAKAWVTNTNPSRFDIVNHIDNDRLNTHYTNLEWTDTDGNKLHSVATGTEGKGEDLYNSTLTDQQVHDMCKLLIDGSSMSDLSKEFGVSKDIVRKLRNGDTYTHIRSLYDIPWTYKNLISAKSVIWVCEMICDGRSDKSIVKLSNNKLINIYEVKRIRNKIRYKHISDMYF